MIQLSLSFIQLYSPNEQLVMLQLLLHANENGVVEFSDRGIAKVTGLSYQQVRTIHQKWLRDSIIANAVANAVSNANRCFVTICEYDSYILFNNISHAHTNAVSNAVDEKESSQEKDINNKKIIKEELSKESPKKKEKNEAKEQMLPLDIEEDKYTFDKVWDLYDKKVGDKDKLRKKWAGIKPKDKIKIFEFIPAYVALTEKAYRKNFQTFLNQKAWTNEDIETNGISVPFGSFNPKLVEDRDLFKQFVINFNNKIRGSGVKEVDLKNGLTEKRRILFNIAYCLHFNQMKKVVENAIKNPRLNGSTGFAADFDYIFKPDNFLRIFEGY